MNSLKHTIGKLIINTLFKLRLLIIFIWLVITLLFAYWIKDFKDISVKDIVAVITCGIIIMTLIYHIINYEHNLKKFNHDVKIARETLSFNIAFKFQETFKCITQAPFC